MKIPKIKNFDYDLKIPDRPCWIPMVDTQGDVNKPIIRCNCGAWLALPKHHIHPDGAVTASVLDDDLKNDKGELIHKGCGWHVYIELEDWTGHDFPPDK